MPVIVLPYIPSTITVHLGLPDQWAENVTVSFPDYVKNVASSEIYPTWELSTIRANVLAIISFALNRVYTEFYPSRGYNFQITNTTAYDQKFIRGRSFFQSISAVVDEIFNDYIRRQGFVEPLSAKFCNGTTSTCDGLSQWGSQEMAQTGYNSMEILRHYYGDDIELVVNAPIQDITQSYPGSSLRLGSVGEGGGRGPDQPEPHLPELPRHPQDQARHRHLRGRHRILRAAVPAHLQPGVRRRGGKGHLV